MPRIAPVEPPYAPEVEAMLRAMMPRSAPVEPLKLFRTFARHPPLAAAILPLGRFLLGRELSLSLREREVVIDRACARCGCEYEWGVHAVAFGARAGLGPAELRATVRGGADDPAWTPRDALLVRLVDSLHDTATVPAPLWEELAAVWSPPQLLELLLLAGWYHALAFLINAVAVEPEAWAESFPSE
jgi:4-carboxymuconolactone decarboxylase